MCWKKGWRICADSARYSAARLVPSVFTAQGPDHSSADPHGRYPRVPSLQLNNFARRCAALLALYIPSFCYAVEFSGLLDIRAVAAGGDRSWTRSGLDKSQYDDRNDGLRLGQGIFAVESELSHAISGSLVLSANDDRSTVVDLQEAWLGWNPLPFGHWKMRAKVGAFFPTRMNLEVDYDRLTWTPTRTLSASAVNSWVGEELRTQGLELIFKRLGRVDGSLHDFAVTGAVFAGNDPAGTLLAWRGWSISDRITGLTESILLADLPLYRANGALPKQSRDIHPFREIDGRPGYYIGGSYEYAGRFEISVMHYDNLGDPLILDHGQYSWATKFNHVGMRLKPAGEWEFLAQAMRGSTEMGPSVVNVNYAAWYLLASHPLGAGRLTVRFDQFWTSGKDIFPSDPNDESGHAVAVAYAYSLSKSLSLITELLAVRSSRSARMLIGDTTKQSENSLRTALQLRF